MSIFVKDSVVSKRPQKRIRRCHSNRMIESSGLNETAGSGSGVSMRMPKYAVSLIPRDPILGDFESISCTKRSYMRNGFSP
jgi:hypothetical protein